MQSLGMGKVLQMRERAAMPERLLNFITRHMADVGDPTSIRFYCCDRLPFLIGTRYSGFTLYSSIYLRRSFFPIDLNDFGTLDLLFHELTHVAQFRRQPLVFPLKYLLHWPRYGYWNLPAEIEARERAAALTQMFLNVNDP
jgi:hypothetical protein